MRASWPPSFTLFLSLLDPATWLGCLGSRGVRGIGLVVFKGGRGKRDQGMDPPCWEQHFSPGHKVDSIEQELAVVS